MKPTHFLIIYKTKPSAIQFQGNINQIIFKKAILEDINQTDKTSTATISHIWNIKLK